MPDPSFPWEKLQEHTDAYLKKKKKHTPEQLEERLVNFIKNHADKMDVAIAASGHAMSPQTLRGLLISDLSVGPGRPATLNSYLQAVVAANRVNPQSVSDVEAQRAKSMIAAAMIGTASAGHYLQALVQIIYAGVPPSCLLYTHIHALALKACTDFATALQNLRAVGELRKAYSAASWLSKISERSFELSAENLSPEQLLDTAFPTWRSWALWRPDAERLRRWDSFSTDQRISLKDLLALEGPDFVGRQKTMREGATISGGLNLSTSPVRLGNLTIELQLAVEPYAALERLMNAIDAASAAGPHDIALLIWKCVGKTITHDALTMLEIIRFAGDSSISSLILPVYAANGEPRSVQMKAAMRLLPILGREQSRELRDTMSLFLVTLICDSFKNLQTNLKSQLENGNVVDLTEINLQDFGWVLLNNRWILTMLDKDIQTLLGDWPTKDEIQSLYRLRESVQSASSDLQMPLTKKVNEVSMDRLIIHGAADKSTKSLIRALLSVWKLNPGEDLRSIAVFVAQGPGFGNELRCRCLNLLPSLPTAFISRLRTIMRGWDSDPNNACVELVKVLAPMPSSDATVYWRLILYGMIERTENVVVYTLRRLKAVEWIQFVADVRSACRGIDPRNSPPYILAPTLLAWVQRITVYIPTLTLLENDLGGSRPEMQCLLTGGDGKSLDDLEAILRAFTTHYKGIHQAVMLAVVKFLDSRSSGSNAATVSKAISSLVALSKPGVDACQRLLNLHQGKTTKLVAEALLASWLQDSNLKALDQTALKALAEVLGMSISAQTHPPAAALEAAADYIDAQFAALFLEAQRLESLRSSHKAIDPKGTSKLLQKLNIEDPSPVEDFMSRLPSSLIGVVEMVADQEIEMQFLLNPTPLQRISMGVGNAKSMVLRLFLSDYSKTPGFCIHLESERIHARAQGHTPWEPHRNKLIPDQHPCYGRPNRTTYQIARVLTRHLHKGFKDLEMIHKVVTSTLKDITTNCLICGTPKPTPLRRSSPCQITCSNIFFRASLEIRLAEIRHDPQVMDLLLTMVHYACASRNMQLLPNCPLSDTLQVSQALSKIPPMYKLTNVDCLTTAIQRLGTNAERLLSWTCLNYRGFLVSATGRALIPGMPAGTQQFLMANAAPNLETAFASKVNFFGTRVLWHGTSLNRLYAITCEGLKVLSNTSLQAHGAASGAGIYTAEEPATSWSYCHAGGASWGGSSLGNMKVILGLEAVGIIGGSGVHVVKDPSSLMVRYVFLVPNNGVVPAAATVAPAMASVYSSLRAGAL